MASCQLIRNETKMEVAHLNQKQLAARWCISEATLERWRSVGIGPKFLKWGIRMSAVSGATGCEEFPHVETAARFSRCSAEQSDLSLIFRDLDLRPGRERGWDA